MRKFTGIVERSGKFLDNLAGLCLVATMAVIVINVLMRAIWHRPLMGTMEYVNIFTTLTVALALAYCSFQNGQIAVDLLVEKLPAKAAAAIDIFTNLAALLFWAVAAYYSVEYGRTMMETGLVASTTEIPLYPVPFLIALGLAALCLVLLQRILISIRKVLA